MQFYPETHQYFLDGRELPSVTHVLRFLSQDAYGTIDKYVLANAAYRGTRVHEATEAYDLYGELPDYEEDYDIYNYALAYASFCNDYKPVWIEIETAITDGEVAGMVDRIGKVKGIYEYIVVDVKSSSKIYTDSVTAQIYKYANMYINANPAIPFMNTYVLQLKNDGSYKFELLNMHRGIEVWNACYNLHKIIENGDNT